MRNQKVVMLVGPLRGNKRAENIERARIVSAALWKQGFAVITSYGDALLHEHSDVPDQVWLDGYLTLMMLCDAILTLDGWENSEGARREIDHALRHNRLIFYDIETLMEWADVGMD